MRVGIMGGTFDPIHVGHLIAASEVHSALHLDQVIFMPAGQPWQKAQHSVSAATHRLEMVRRAVAHDERFIASDMEILREGPTYAIDTVRQLLNENPGIDIYWIVGTDALAGIPTWRDWEEFVSLVTVVSVNRESVSDAAVPFKHTFVQMPLVRISASDVRRRFQDGFETRYLVPDAVREYVNEQGLYRG